MINSTSVDFRRLIPRSHLTPDFPGGGDPAADHPDEIILTGRAGSVAVFNSHLFHAGGNNESARYRRGVLAYFGRRAALGTEPEFVRWTNWDGSPGAVRGPQTWPTSLSAETRRRLTPEASALAGLRPSL